MARPMKDGLDYFSHDTDASSNVKIRALTELHGNDGYAFFFIHLEMIYRSSSLELDLSDSYIRKIYARQLKLTEEKYDEILETALHFRCFDPDAYRERQVLTSQSIRIRAEVVLEKRRKMNGSYEQKRRKKAGVSETETTHSIEKNSIVKKNTEQRIEEEKEKLASPDGDVSGESSSSLEEKPAAKPQSSDKQLSARPRERSEFFVDLSAIWAEMFAASRGYEYPGITQAKDDNAYGKLQAQCRREWKAAGKPGQPSSEEAKEWFRDLFKRALGIREWDYANMDPMHIVNQYTRIKGKELKGDVNVTRSSRAVVADPHKYDNIERY